MTIGIGARNLPLKLNDFPYTIATIGDSLAGESNPYWNVIATQTWPSQIQERLNAVGAKVKSRSYAIGGQTTSNLLAKFQTILRFGVPQIVGIFGGANDRPAAGQVNGGGATTTVIPLGAGGGASMSVGGYVEISGEIRKVLSVATDTIVLDAALSTAPANATLVWAATRRNIFEMLKLAQAAGCNRCFVVGSHYKNWSSGGDTTASEESLYGALRLLQAASVADAAGAGVDAIYIDTYGYMRSQILAGTYAQGDNSYSAVTNNQHLNLNGHTAIADAIMLGINAKHEWLSTIR